ncbi:MAG: substrate-binding domain-containing protein [Spirochaetales bacterium]|nr:substrate-binding domain-containing protein [Spirochaetales bacterium]MDY5914981.1 substrate-binding domain-containing protein [Treponema sp.]
MRIGLFLNLLDEEYQISVYKGIVKKAKEHGVEIVCFQQDNKNMSMEELVSQFPKKHFFNVDGIILLTSVITDNFAFSKKEDIEKYWENIPVISVGQKIKNVPSLMIETDESMKELVEHLILKHNYKKFLYIGGSPKHHDAILREQIFKKTLDAYQPWFSDLQYTIKYGFFLEHVAIQALEEYLQENDDNLPDVVVCANDNMALGIYKFFKMNSERLNMKECAVTGFDDVPQAKFEIPALTTIHQPLEEIGEKSLELIKEFVEKKSVSDETFIESKVMYRNSCGCNSDLLKQTEDILIEQNKNNDMQKFLKHIQSKYVRSENILRIVNRIAQQMNNISSIDGLNYVISGNISQLEVTSFCILKFKEYELKKSVKNNQLYVLPIYVKRNKNEFFDFSKGKTITFGEFYQKFLEIDNSKQTSLIFKYLRSGDDIIGCILYEASHVLLPYITSISNNIAQVLNRLKSLEEKEKYSEYLEKEVTKRTKELVKANNKRMKVEAEVLKISELERQRFSNDLHDDICQRLAGISMLCRSYSNQTVPVTKEQMVELAQLTGETLQCTRQYAHNSYPVELDSLGMNNSLSNLCNSFSIQSGISCDYKWNVNENLVFDKIKLLNLFRIIQEALHNVLKHSKASKVEVSVNSEKNKIIAKVCDNGCGISKNAIKEKKGIGMNSMEYRANQIGAEFKIEQNKPSGTCVIVTVDLNSTNDIV